MKKSVLWAVAILTCTATASVYAEAYETYTVQDAKEIQKELERLDRMAAERAEKLQNIWEIGVRPDLKSKLGEWQRVEDPRIISGLPTSLRVNPKGEVQLFNRFGGAIAKAVQPRIDNDVVWFGAGNAVFEVKEILGTKDRLICRKVGIKGEEVLIEFRKVSKVAEAAAPAAKPYPHTAGDAKLQ